MGTLELANEDGGFVVAGAFETGGVGIAGSDKRLEFEGEIIRE